MPDGLPFLQRQLEHAEITAERKAALVAAAVPQFAPETNADALLLASPRLKARASETEDERFIRLSVTDASERAEAQTAREEAAQKALEQSFKPAPLSPISQKLAPVGADLTELTTDTRRQQALEAARARAPTQPFSPDTSASRRSRRLLLGAEGRPKLLGSQIAVLYRANWQSREFERALLKKSIPYEVVNGLPFFQRREIKDLTSYLRLVANPRDEVAFQRVVNTPTRGIGDTTLDALTAWAKLNKQTLSAALLADVDDSLPSEKQLGITARAHGFVCDFRAMVASWQRKAAALPVRGLLQQIVTDIAYEKHLEDDDDVDERLGTVEELLSLAAPPAEGADPDAPLPTGLDALSGFLEDAALMSAQDMANKELPNSVRLQTMHSAKGLEFEAVFAVGLEDDIIPSPRALKDAGPRYGEVYDEERRLFYVAVTRAKARLYLCHAQSRYMYGELTSQDISPLLGDVVHALGRDAKRVLLKEFAEPQREAAARAYDSSGSVGAGKWDTDARMRAHVPRPMAAGRTRAASTVAAGRRPPLPPPAPMTPQRSQAKTAQTLSDGQGMAAMMAQKAAAAAAKRAAKGTP